MRKRFFKLFWWRIPRKIKKAAKYGVESVSIKMKMKYLPLHLS